MERNATIAYEEEIGLRPLAYPIAHKKSGVYHLIEFVSVPDLIKELEITYSRDEEVLRFLTFSLNKHALAHNAARRLVAVDEKQELKQEAAL
jgi:small subunit ribosomal protein S6